MFVKTHHLIGHVSKRAKEFYKVLEKEKLLMSLGQKFDMEHGRSLNPRVYLPQHANPLGLDVGRKAVWNSYPRLYSPSRLQIFHRWVLVTLQL